MKRTIQCLFLAFYVVAGLSACDKIRKDKGVIISDPGVSICPLPIDTTDEWVIRTQAQYDSLLSEAGCTAIPVDVDFNACTLLGKYTVSGCNTRYFRQVLQNDDEHTIRYNILVKSREACNKSAISYNWVIVPKVPDNYTVEFTVKKK